MPDDAPQIDHMARLNQSFYRGVPPSAYFRERLNLLALRATNVEELAGLFGDDFAWGDLRLRPLEDDPDVDGSLEQRTASFVATESQVLKHHASEALIRLFLAHSGYPECPWLEAAALRLPSTFRNQLDELRAPRWSDQLIDDTAHVFLIGRPANPDEAWSEALDCTVRCLQLLAGHLHDDKELYNATKHGMAVISGDASLTIKAEEAGAEPRLGANGASMVFLEREHETKKWYESQRWVKIHQAVWLTQLAISQMECLWSVAQHRYLEKPIQGLNVVTKEALDVADAGFPNAGSITSFRIHVATDL